MPKTRMLIAAKKQLKRFAKERVVNPEAKLDLAVCSAAFAELVKAHLLSLYPQADMEVLEKYGKASRFSEITVYGSVPGTRNRREVKVTLPGPALLLPYRQISVADDHDSSYDSMRTPEAREAFAAVVEAFDTLAMHNAEAVAPYLELINRTYYFEDLVAIWPEAEAMRAQVGAPSPQLPMKTIDAVVEAVKADMQRRGVKVETE